MQGSEIEKLKPYKAPQKSMILVPLGPSIGNSFIGFNAGNWITSKLKERDLFLTHRNKGFQNG